MLSRNMIIMMTFVHFLPVSAWLYAQPPVNDSLDHVPYANKLIYEITYRDVLTKKLLESENNGKLLMYRFVANQNGDRNKRMINVTDEQKKLMNDKVNILIQQIENEADEKGLGERMGKIDEMDIESVLALANESANLNMKIIDEGHEIFLNVLSTEQLYLARCLDMALPSQLSEAVDDDFNFSFNFDVWEVLNFNEPQKEKLKELQSELDEMQKEYFDMHELRILHSKPTDRVKNQSLENYLKRRNNLQKKNKEYHEEIVKSIESILTDEQKIELQKIRNMFPEIRSEFRRTQGRNFQKSDESWKHSWKPGSPIPESAVRKLRQRRFPIPSLIQLRQESP